MQECKRGIIVLGMGRSGTSLVAELVYRWGASAIEEKLLPANPMNPHGFWEHAPLVHFDDELLRAVNSEWGIPPTEQDKVVLAGLVSQPIYREKAQALLSEMMAAVRPWFWKDPRLVLLLPFWKQLWGEVVYIVPIRNPIDIAASLRTWLSYPISASLLLWQRYMSTILQDDEVVREAFFIDYDKLIEYPARECQRLCQYLNEKYKLPLQRTGEQVKSMAGAVDPSLRRSRNHGHQFTTSATQQQKALYRALVRRLKDSSSTMKGNFDPDPGWREYLMTVSVMKQLASFSDSEKLHEYIRSLPTSFLETYGFRRRARTDEE